MTNDGDLTQESPEEQRSRALKAHWKSRRERVLRNLDTNGRGLEIGPSYRPLMPRSEFPDVKILDHTDAETLREKYRRMKHPESNIEQIEEVDYIWAGGSLTTAVPEGEKFDFALGSHLIEHTVDLIGFLQDCQALLRPGGRLALVVPDRRFCFDHFQPLTNAGAVIDAHWRPTTFHPPGELMNHMLYAVSRGEGQIAWRTEFHAPMKLQFRDLDQADTWMAIATAQEEYFDLHRWRFTPSSLALLVEDLAILGYHQMRLVGEPDPASHEFYITLENDPDYRPTYDPDARMVALMAIEGEVSAATELAVRAAELEAEVASLRVKLGEVEGTLADVLGSTSWKLTKPLRAVKSRGGAE